MPPKNQDHSGVRFSWTGEMEHHLVDLLCTQPQFHPLFRARREKTGARRWILLQELCVKILNKSGCTANVQWVEAAIAGGSLRRRSEDGSIVPTASWASALADPVERKVKSLYKNYETHREKLADLSSFDEVPTCLQAARSSAGSVSTSSDDSSKVGITRETTPLGVSKEVCHNDVLEEAETPLMCQSEVDMSSIPHILTENSPSNCQRTTDILRTALIETSCDTFDTLSKACKQELLSLETTSTVSTNLILDASSSTNDRTARSPRAIHTSREIIDLTMESDTELTGLEEEHVSIVSPSITNRRLADLALASPALDPAEPLSSPPPPTSTLNPTSEAHPVTDFAPQLRLKVDDAAPQARSGSVPPQQPKWKTCPSPASPRTLLSPDLRAGDLSAKEESLGSLVSDPIEEISETMIDMNEIDELDQSEKEMEILVELSPRKLPKRKEKKTHEQVKRASDEGKESQLHSRERLNGARQLFIEPRGLAPSSLAQRHRGTAHTESADELIGDIPRGPKRDRCTAVYASQLKRRRLIPEIELPPVKNRQLYATFPLVGQQLGSIESPNVSASGNAQPSGDTQHIPLAVSEEQTHQSVDTIPRHGQHALTPLSHAWNLPSDPSDEVHILTSPQPPVVPDPPEQPTAPSFLVSLPQDSFGEMSDPDSEPGPEPRRRRKARRRDNVGNQSSPKQVSFAIPSPMVVKIEPEEAVLETPQEMLRKARSAVFERSWLREAKTKALSSRKLRSKIDKERCRLFAYALTQILSSRPLECLKGCSVMIEQEALESTTMGKRARMVQKLVHLASGTRGSTIAELMYERNPSKRIIVGLGCTNSVEVIQSTNLRDQDTVVWHCMSILEFLRLLDRAYHRASAIPAEQQTSTSGSPSVETTRFRSTNSEPSAPARGFTDVSDKYLLPLIDSGIPVQPVRLTAGEIARLLRIGRSERMNGDWSLEDMLSYETENQKSEEYGRAFLERKRADRLSRAYFELQRFLPKRMEVLCDCYFMQLCGDDLRQMSRDSKLGSVIRCAGGHLTKSSGFANANSYISRHIVVPDRRVLSSRKHVIIAESQAAQMITELDLLLWIDRRYREKGLIPIEIERRV
ncbi:hypothetical protein I316_02623 [Kwoniella heveanensis BCC8398]|uniref:BRCT domain-containing protein n=1 Tax=Kwoniella heveanensis BCC8398 TaxID=1296120 RepID=A0A1B9GX27_9TREE|nr:hypothetical protein I316_02623 [Kwoniella heveanensis BCC8398]